VAWEQEIGLCWLVDCPGPISQYEWRLYAIGGAKSSVYTALVGAPSGLR
jgi:hypothetical protein